MSNANPLTTIDLAGNRSAYSVSADFISGFSSTTYCFINLSPNVDAIFFSFDGVTDHGVVEARRDMVNWTTEDTHVWFRTASEDPSPLSVRIMSGEAP